MKIELKNIDSLVPYWRNPRHNEEAVEALKNSIRRYGYNVPIVIDKNDVIITGHARYKALKQLGYKQVKCVIADMDEEKAREYRLVDNKVAEYSKWDMEALKVEVRGIDEADVLKGLGFTEREIENMLRDTIGEGVFQYDDDMIQEVDRKTKEVFKERSKEAQDNYIEVVCSSCGGVFYLSRRGLTTKY